MLTPQETIRRAIDEGRLPQRLDLAYAPDRETLAELLRTYADARVESARLVLSRALEGMK